MKKIFILSALISFTIFTACNKEEVTDGLVPLDEELAMYNTDNQDEDLEDNSVTAGEAAFTINNKDNTLYEKRRAIADK